MIHLKTYVIEELSKNNTSRLKNAIKKINDDNANYVLPKIEQTCREANLIGEEYKKFFINKGLDNKSFSDKKEEIGLLIGTYFAECKKEKMLTKIVKNNGLINYETLLKNLQETSNIYDICDRAGFKNVAKKISNIAHVKSNQAPVGKFEILLKFLLKENAVKQNHGDITIEYPNDNVYGLEVKGGNKLDSSARIISHATISPKMMTEFFVKNLNLNNKEKEILFGKAGSNERLENILNENNIKDINKIISEIVKTFAFQYGVIESEKEYVNDVINIVIEYNKRNQIFELHNNKITIKRLTQLFGVIQLMFYAIKCKWDSIFVVNQITGYYRICSSLKNYKDKYKYIDYIFDNVEFYDFSGAPNNTRDTGSRIFPK